MLRFYDRTFWEIFYMRRLLSTILTLTLMMQFFIIPAYAKPDWPADTGILAEGGIVIDMDSGTVLFGQNIRVGYYPASITKLLTALVVLEHASLDEEVAFSHDAVYNIEEGSGNYFGLDEGDKWPVEDCLYALILRSSNQAANALAEHVGGTRDGFVDMMNETIEKLGCTGSRFKNPSGLNDPEQVVTPYDMALIAKAAFSNEKLLEIASSKRHKFPPTVNTPEEISATIDRIYIPCGQYSGNPCRTGWKKSYCGCFKGRPASVLYRQPEPFGIWLVQISEYKDCRYGDFLYHRRECG